MSLDVGTTGELNMLAGAGRVHNGVGLDCSPLETSIADANEMIAIGGARPDAVWLALDEIQDPHNLGAILRSALFLGAAGVIVSTRNSAPLSPTVSKTSAGSLELLQLRSVGQMPLLLHELGASGFDILGASSRVRHIASCSGGNWHARARAYVRGRRHLCPSSFADNTRMLHSMLHVA
jgi:21S rRNA (GM2251-2'-O)-methyltransferase